MPFFSCRLRSSGIEISFLDSAQTTIFDGRSETKRMQHLANWSVERFRTELTEAVPNVTEAQAQIMGFEETISRVMVNFDLQDVSHEE